MWPELFDASAWIGERLAIGSLQGAVAVGVAWAACRWIPRIPAAVQAWVWWLVAAKLVAALLPLPSVPLPLLPASRAGAVRPAPAGATSDPTGVRVDPAAAQASAQAMGSSASPASAGGLNVFGAFAAAWLVGVLLHGFLLARAAVTTRRLVRGATPLAGVDLAAVSRMAAVVGLRRLPCVSESPEVDVPQVVGFWNPVVLLPAAARGRFTDSEWRMALSHELLHVRRRDVLLGWLPALAERLYFFHPLARLAAREYVMAREAACDAAVVRVLDVPADDYGRLLIRLGVTRSRSVLVASSASPTASCLRRRLEMLQHTSSTTVSRLATAAVAAAALLAVAPVEIVAQRLPDPPALPALPAPPAPPALPAATARALPPAAPVAPAPPIAPIPPARPVSPAQAAAPAPPAPAPPSAPAAPMAPMGPMPPAAPLPPQPPSPPSGDEVVLRLKVPATEQEAIDTAVRVLETQLAQIEQQAANVQVTIGDAELQQIRRKLEEMMALMQGQTRAGQNLQQRSAEQLARQMAELNRQREALLRQEREVQRQLAQMAQQIERMKIDLQAAQEAAKKR